MKINITGGGAMGGLFAAHLVSTDHSISIYDTDRQHVEAIRRNGLILAGNGVTRALPMLATADPATLGLMDIVMIFVKYGQTRDAMDGIAPMIGPGTVIVTLQNGVGNVEIIRRKYANPLVYGLTTLTSERLGPGHIEASFEGAGETYFATAEREDADQSVVLQAILNGAGINCAVAQNIDQKIWNKLVVNCCLNTTCAITDLPVGRLIDRPGIWPILDDLSAEICAVARGLGIALEASDASRYLREVAVQARHHAPSMLADVRARRNTEIECLNGAVVRFGSRLGVPTPQNKMLTLLVQAIEASWLEDDAPPPA